MKNTPETLIAGQLVYSRSGEKALFVAKDKNSFIVRPYIWTQDWYGEEHEQEGNLTSWHEIFPKAPREVIDEEITQLNNEYNALNSKLIELNGQFMAQEGLVKAQKAKFARHEKLKNLEDFIDGKITHYLKFDSNYDRERSSFQIVEAAKEYCGASEHYQRNRDLKLVSLMGKSDGDLAWRINHYSDDSGNTRYEIIPCKSYDEAIIEAQKVINLACEKYKKDNQISIGLITSAQKYNLVIPVEIQEYLGKLAEEKRVKQLERARENLEKAKKELLDLEAGIPSNKVYPNIAKEL
jgi:chromosome segregation and condensation protein ScpB